jgi:polyribonucleotide nucleotidyltransferase
MNKKFYNNSIKLQKNNDNDSCDINTNKDVQNDITQSEKNISESSAESPKMKILEILGEFVNNQNNQSNKKKSKKSESTSDKPQVNHGDDELECKNQSTRNLDEQNKEVIVENQNLENSSEQKDDIEETDIETNNEKINKYKELFGQSITLKFKGEDLTIYFNGLAMQSNASALITYKLVSILCALDLSESSDEYTDFTQLTVHFLTKSYAFSRIPNGISKRENKSSERDILLSRLIDRSIRPMVQKNFQQPMQLICTLLSHHTTPTQTDLDVEFLSVIGSIAAFQLSSVPLINMPVGVRIGMKNDKFIFCPYSQELHKSPLDLFLSFSGDEVIMIECEAKNLSKETLIEAVSFARKEKIELENFLLSLSQFAKPKIQIEPESKKLSRMIKVRYSKDIKQLLEISDKTERNSEFNKLEKRIINELTDDDLFLSRNDIAKNFFDVKKKEMRNKIFETEKRIDGRKIDALREISSNMNIPFMTSSHGSSIFSRGKTKALVSVILGTTYDEQIVEGFESDRKERFILHYNFPPYATGEASQIKTPSRREIGHAKLAFKALRNFIPEKQDFPYTIRVSSEILSCDGSSSMATICGATLAMIDAGVPLKNLVAGIAIGVVTKNDTGEIRLLTDLIGDEDHLGDMDFKVAGTSCGITALQMDVKDFGIKNDEVLSQILEHGTNGLQIVLANMNKEIEAQKEIIKTHAPLISQISVDKSQAKLIIGNRGDTIKTISEMSGARIDVDSSNNVVSIFANNRNAINKARDIIEDLILQAEVGKIYDGVVEKITDFGIFVKFMNEKMRGLVHEKNCENDIYEFHNLKKSLKVGDSIKVKVMFISSDGKIGLSIIPSEKKNDNKNNENSGENSGNNSESSSNNSQNENNRHYSGNKSLSQNDVQNSDNPSNQKQQNSNEHHDSHDKKEQIENDKRFKKKSYTQRNDNFSEQQEDDFLKILNNNSKTTEKQSNQNDETNHNHKSKSETEKNLNPIIEEKKDTRYNCVFF